MINPTEFVDVMLDCNIDFAVGVPDSLLKNVCAAISTLVNEQNHMIAANEGAAVGLAIGHYLGTGGTALVYMQNSGLGNAINPLTSLADPTIYSVPMILLIGWRGEITADGSQRKDEPQHLKQGRITLGQLDLLGIPYQVIDEHTDIRASLRGASSEAISRSGPVALVVRAGAFSQFELSDERGDLDLMSREVALRAVVELLDDDAIVVATTGMLSRELYEIRKADGTGHHRDFLTVGGMGHASSIAVGLAKSVPERRVVCLDGDGAILMHMGTMATSSRSHNLVHIAFNNGAHDSVGGQPTEALRLDISEIAEKCKYDLVLRTEEVDGVVSSVLNMLRHRGSSFLEIMCRRGSRPDLGRPEASPAENIRSLRKYLEDQ